MKKLNVALINNVQYCKFPNGINNIKDFIEFLNGNYHSFVELEFLIAEGCVAPFYIEEDLKTEKQYWNPSNIRNIKESEVSILRRWEYEEKLKSNENVDEKIISSFERVDMIRALHECKEPYREVLYQRIFGNLSFREIGDVLGKSENWARVTYYRGKEKLKKEIKELNLIRKVFK